MADHDSSVTAPVPTSTQPYPDTAYAVVVGLIDRHVPDPDMQFKIKRAVIEYGKQEAFQAIDKMTAQIRSLHGLSRET